MEIEAKGYKLDDFAVVKISKEKINVSDSEREKIDSLVEALEENDDVQDVYTNAE